MPAAIIKGRLLKRCEVCGNPAQFGTNVNLTRAMKAHSDGQTDRAKKLLGRWYCLEHRSEND